MLFQAFTNHLCRLSSFKVFIICNFIFSAFNLISMLFTKGLFFQFPFIVLQLNLTLKFKNCCLFFLYRIFNR